MDEISRAIRRIHSVDTLVGCERIGGTWFKKHGICELMDYADPYIDIGWTAPVKGAYFWWEVHDLGESTGEEQDYGKLIGHVTGCLVKDSHDYPDNVGWCQSIYDYEKIFDEKTTISPWEQIRNHCHMVAGDVLKGRGYKHGLAYFTPTGKIVQGPSRGAFVGDRAGVIFKDMKKYSKPPFRLHKSREIVKRKKPVESITLGSLMTRANKGKGGTA